jgi:UPF0716 protein FxsA
MFFKLLAAFILIPLVELYLLLQVAKYTSVGTTIVLVVLTGILGTTLARREGMRALFRFQTAIAEGRMPSREIMDGLMIVFAGALLLTPGLLTDAAGFLLLLPVCRDLVRKHVLQHYLRRFEIRSVPLSRDEFVEGEFDSFRDEALDRQIQDAGNTLDAESVRHKP